MTESKRFTWWEDGEAYSNYIRPAVTKRLAEYEDIGTIEEFKALKQWKADIIESFCKYDVNSVDELMKRFKELKEKAKPKKPLNIRPNGSLNAIFDCPSCGRTQKIQYQGFHCKECGQNLDWE